MADKEHCIRVPSRKDIGLLLVYESLRRRKLRLAGLGKVAGRNTIRNHWCFRKSERIFITAKVADYIKVGRDDLIEQYLFLITSHDGFGSITAAFTPVRVVCANTLNAAQRTASNAIKIRHTASAKERLEQAHQLMGISNTLSLEMEQLFNRWARVKITDPEIKRLIQIAMVPNKEVLQNSWVVRVIAVSQESYKCCRKVNSFLSCRACNFFPLTLLLCRSGNYLLYLFL